MSNSNYKIDQMIALFKSFSIKESVLIKENLSRTLSALKAPSQKALKMMEEKSLTLEDLTGASCLALLRFELADDQVKKSYFLSESKLLSFFKELPTAEASLLRLAIEKAKPSLAIPSEELYELMQEAGVFAPVRARTEKIHHESAVIDLSTYHKNESVPSIAKKAPSSSERQQQEDHFFMFEDERLHIVEMGSIESMEGIWLYHELSPLQQLKAQELIEYKKENQKLKHTS